MTKKTSLLVLCSLLTVGTIFGQHKDLAFSPQCVVNDDCPEDSVCTDLTCGDPCLGICKGNSNCQVRAHVPYCTCNPGYTGDPFTGCRQQTTAQVQCVTNENCPRDRVCVGHKCVDPCLGVCSYNSTCQVIDHVPYCSCRPGYYGDPLSKCKEKYPAGSWPPFPGARKRFQAETIKTNWYGAFAQCMNHGGRLASVYTKEENDQVKGVIKRSGLSANFWGSGTDYALGNHWTWMNTGKPFTFTDWSDNQPDNWQNLPGGEHCLEFWSETEFRWNDRNCLEQQYSICEYYDAPIDKFDVEWRIHDAR